MLKKAIKNFLYSDIYLVLLCFASFICWQLKLDIVGMSVMAFVFFCVMCFAKDGAPSIPALVWYMLTISKNHNATFIRANVVVLLLHATCVFGSIGIYLYRNGVKIRLGKQFVGFLAMFVAMALGGILFDINLTIKSFPSVFTIYFCMIIGYLYFGNVIKNNNPKYFAKIMTYTGLLIALQTLNYFLTCGYSFTTIINHKTLEVGWGNSNSIGALIVLIIPFTMYLISKIKLPILYVLLFFVEVVTLVFSLSRGALLMGAVGIPLLCVYTCVKAKSKVTVIGSFIYMIIVGIVLLVVNMDEVRLIFDQVGSLDSNGRFSLYKEAYSEFLKSPIFGTSMYGAPSVDETNMFQVRWFHSTPMQFIANAGIVGVIGYLVHLAFKYKMLLSKGDIINKFILIAVLMWSGYALIDVLYFSQNQIVFLVLSLVFAEKNVYNKGEIERFFPKKIKKSIKNR